MISLLGLYQEAEDEGIPVFDFQLSHREAMSLKDTDGQCYIALDYHKVESEQHEKCLLAHELSHCETDAFYTSLSPFELWGKYERRATKLMVQRLVPEKELRSAVRQGCTEVWELAERFEVTEDIIVKAAQLYGYWRS